MDRSIFILTLAQHLRAQHMTLNGPQLVAVLNTAGLTSDAGHPYAFGANRGIYRTLNLLEASLRREGRDNDADAVATAFTQRDGRYAYALEDTAEGVTAH